MVELDWVPVGLSPEKPSEISYRYRTLLYMNANIVFRHKSFYDLQFTKPKAFLLQKEEGAWKFDLIQMIRSPTILLKIPEGFFLLKLGNRGFS